MDEMLDFRRKHRQSIDIPIAPVLDMMVAVIFFLLLSSTFEAYTKQTLPPSKVTTVEDAAPSPPSPLPRLLVYRTGRQVQMILNWEGTRPGRIRQQVSSDDPTKYSKEIYQAATQLTKRFRELYPDENSLRLGFNKEAKYQDLITVMDGAGSVVPTIVLISYGEAAASQRENI